ncbi:MAG: ATP-binding protein [Nitrospirota bacterium]
MSIKSKSHGFNFKGVGITLFILILTLTVTTLYFKEMDAPSLFPTNILVLTLVNVNLILVVLLALLLSRNLIKLFFERRQRLLGSGFRTKLIASFIGFSLIPTILLFVVASGLLTSSIENWFSIQVERSLSDSLEVAQFYYEEKKDAVLHNISRISETISKGRIINNKSKLNELLADILKESDISALSVFNSELKKVAVAIDDEFDETSFITPSLDLIKNGIKGESKVIVRSTGIGDMIRGVFPLYNANRNKVRGVVIADLYIDSLLVGKMEDIVRSLEDYNQLKAFKNPIKGSYILSFLIITFVVLFSATWFGFYLAKRITVPIQKLAEGTQEIAQGNLDFKIDVEATDEIGVLVDSFNKMTNDLQVSQAHLKDANISLKSSNIELDQRRRYIEIVLESITTGVISINNDGKITTFNHPAEKILNIKKDEIIGSDYKEFLSGVNMEPIFQLIKRTTKGREDFIEEDIQIKINKRLTTLRIGVSHLKGMDKDYIGKVIVFDDLTELIRVQKMAAWQEVAQRMAHEIKNPLTPIQLSAQRMRKKYLENAPDFDTIINDAANIIINEVNSLKNLVNEFSNFARMPAPAQSPNNIHHIIMDVVNLYKGIYKDMDILCDFADDIPLLNIDRDQIKRVFINLFENAVEAMNNKGRLWVNTSYDPVQERTIIEVIDEGIGIPPDDRTKLFLPYFSQKKTGTGLGLAIVNRIISDHNGHISVVDNEPKGTNFIIELP